jgi:flagellin FlaB
MWNKYIKNDKGFTGLEAAIVLIAFVVVAAVFSYVMLGAGFFTTQKSQQVVHTGVTQASSSIETTGDIIATGTASTATVPGFINLVTIDSQLTSGGTPVDMANTILIVSATGIAPTELKLDTSGAAPGAQTFVIKQKYKDNSDNILDPGEQFDLQIDLNAVAGASPVTANQNFQVQIEPPQGASFTLSRTAPPVISPIMTLN